MCEGIVKEFDELEIDESVVKPKVGIVGEILVKYMPLANNYLVVLLEREGAEAVVPDLMDFINYSFYNSEYKYQNYNTKYLGLLGSRLAIKSVAFLRRHAVKALSKSKRFSPPVKISEIAQMTKPFLSIGNQYGESWFLAGEMIELITHGTPNVVCIQPFACLPITSWEKAL